MAIGGAIERSDTLSDCDGRSDTLDADSDYISHGQVLGRDAVPEPRPNVGSDTVAFLRLIAGADVGPVVRLDTCADGAALCAVDCGADRSDSVTDTLPYTVANSKACDEDRFQKRAR